MYIETDPYNPKTPGRRPIQDVEPWIKKVTPMVPCPPRDILPFIPKFPIVIDKDNDEFPISKDYAENFDKEKREAEQKEVLKGARRVLNKYLKTGKRSFEISTICMSSYAHLKEFMVSQIIKEYTAAGWQVKRVTRPAGQIEEDYECLEFS